LNDQSGGKGYLRVLLWDPGFGERYLQCAGTRRAGQQYVLLAGVKLTGYGPRLFGILASNEKHHVTLTGVDIVIFQKEDLVNTVFLESAKFDEKTNRPSQRLLNDQVLLASDLDIAC